MDRQRLFAEVLSDINRKDKGDYLPGWLSSAEFQINETLRHDKMVKHSILAITDRNFVAPPNFIEASGSLSVRAGSDPAAPGPVLATLKYMAHDQMGDGWGVPDAWNPRPPLWYTVRGREYELAGWNIDKPYLVDLWYYGELDKLPNDTSTNWLLTSAPHVYKDAMKYFAFQHLEEYDLADRALGSMAGTISLMNNNAEKRKMSDGPLIRKGIRGYGADFRKRR